MVNFLKKLKNILFNTESVEVEPQQTQKYQKIRDSIDLSSKHLQRRDTIDSSPWSLESIEEAPHLYESDIQSLIREELVEIILEQKRIHNQVIYYEILYNKDTYYKLKDINDLFNDKIDKVQNEKIKNGLIFSFNMNNNKFRLKIESIEFYKG